MSAPLDGFRCSLSNDLMQDPVVALDGYSYERNVIQTWFSNNKKAADKTAPLRADGSTNWQFFSPKTGQKLESDLLVSNISLKNAIQAWSGGGGMGGMGGMGMGGMGGNQQMGGSSSSTGGPGGAGMYVPGYVVGIPSQNQQAMTAYPSLVDGRVIAPSHKPQWDWAWDVDLAPKNLEIAYGSRVARRYKDMQEVQIEDLITLCKRPIRLFTTESLEFHVEIVETSTAWGGLQIGVVPDCMEIRDPKMVYTAIDNRGFYVDADRWYHTPGSEGNQLCSFNSGNLKKNDVVSVVLSDSEGSFYVFKNGKKECCLKTECPVPCGVEHPPLFPFVILTGNCQAVCIGVPRPPNLVLPPECVPRGVDPSMVNMDPAVARKMEQFR